MPRNTAGVYTLPDPPVVANTVIDPIDENTTRDDIALELTNSLDRNGRGGMLAPFRIADGLLAQPGLAFTLDPDNGMYRIGTDNWAFAAGGTKVAEMLPNQFIIPAGSTLNVLGGSTFGGQGLFPDGTLAAPGIAWVNEPTMGWYRPVVGNLHFVVGGQVAGALNVDGIYGKSVFAGDGTLGNPGMSWTNEPSAGFIRTGGGFQYIIAGAPLLGLQTGVFTVIGRVTASNYQASGGVVGPYSPGTNYLYNSGMFTIGASGNYGFVNNFIANSAGATAIYHQFVPSGASAVGLHRFVALNGNGRLDIMGGGYGAGSGGATIQVVNAGGSPLGGIDTIDMGSSSAQMRFTVLRNGTFNTGGDFVMRPAETSQKPQFVITSGWSGVLDLANVPRAPLSIIGTASNALPAIHMTDNVSGIWVHTMSNNSLLWGQYQANGPVSGWSMQLQANGALAAAAYTNASDAALKSDIAPITGALAALKLLHGIRYKQTWDNAPMMGLTAQDVEPVFPELVGEAKGAAESDTPIKTLNYIGLIAPMIEAMRELDARLTALGG